MTGISSCTPDRLAESSQCGLGLNLHRQAGKGWEYLIHLLHESSDQLSHWQSLAMVKELQVCAIQLYSAISSFEMEVFPYSILWKSGNVSVQQMLSRGTHELV